jgi:DNA-binding PucR family transcriptional regulator
MVLGIEEGSSVALYEDLGLHFVALNTLSDEYLLSFQERFVEPLMKLDRTGGKQLYETLVAYLSHERSVTATARHLFLHRNTLIRRLHQASQALGVDLRNTDDLMQLRMGMYAADILRLRGSTGLNEDGG